MRRIRRHLTFANVASAVALFVALGGGTAVALSGSNTVFTDDIANDTQPASGGNPAGGLVAADLRPGSVGSSEVINNSIALADLAPSALTKGRATTNASCDPDTTGFVGCGTLTIDLARTSRVEIVASGAWHSNGPVGGTRGVCSIAVDGALFGASVFPGELADITDSTHEQSVTLTNVTDPLAAGTHTFGLGCNQQQGDIDFDETFVSVALLGPA